MLILWTEGGYSLTSLLIKVIRLKNWRSILFKVLWSIQWPISTLQYTPLPSVCVTYVHRPVFMCVIYTGFDLIRHDSTCTTGEVYPSWAHINTLGFSQCPCLFLVWNLFYSGLCYVYGLMILEQRMTDGYLLHYTYSSLGFSTQISVHAEMYLKRFYTFCITNRLEKKHLIEIWRQSSDQRIYARSIELSHIFLNVDQNKRCPLIFTKVYFCSPVKDTIVTNDRWGKETMCIHGDFWTCMDRYNPGNVLLLIIKLNIDLCLQHINLYTEMNIFSASL